jgi:penicillin amidase
MTTSKTGARIACALLSSALATSALAENPISAPTLSAPGSITYDAEGVPVIQAATENDAAFLEGYAHARDRFFEMDFNRRVASGTVAELVGAGALANVVQLRTLGGRRAATTTAMAMSDTTRGWLKSYADGVNFWLQTNPLPPEYGALEITKAQQWQIVDSIVIGKALAFQLSFDLDIDYTQKLGAYQQAGAQAGFNGVALFFEDTHRVQPPDGRVTVPGFHAGTASGKSTVGVPEVSDETLALAKQLYDRIKDVPLLGASLHRSEDRGGSNVWAVAGSKTKSHKAILANDPHLALDLPPVFQELHLSTASGLNVTGVSVPGTPGVIQGCNARICWATTQNPLDVTDTFQERFVLNTFGLPTATLYNGQPEPVLAIFNLFYVNQLDGVADNPRIDPSIGYLNGALTILVPRRNFGPVLSITGNTGLSVQYTGWGATFELEAFRRINASKNLDEFRNALTYFDVGSQNFGYADVDGNIAYFTSAEAPVRDDLQNLSAIDGSPPFLIRDGTGAHRNEWLPVLHPQPNQAVPYEILPASEMPFVINPSAGYVANANNDPIGNTLDNNAFNQLRPGGGLYYLNFGYASYRVGRIDRELQKLVARGEIYPEDMQALQANNQLMDAELVRPYLLAAFQNAQAASAPADLRALGADAQIAEAITRLGNWDFSTPTGIKEGFDPGDNPASLPEPSTSEVNNSVAATLFAAWRGQAIRNTIDATLGRVGLSAATPSSTEAYTAFKHLLDAYATQHGVGASGLNFFAVTGVTSPEAARDIVLLRSLRDALTLLASDGFAPAFNRSTSQGDYRWGKLHRIVFDHPLGGPFNLPGMPAYGFSNLSTQLPGVAKAGGYDTVDAASHNTRANSLNGFMFGNGPARRFVGDLTTPADLRQILPGGESGVLGSPFYASQLSRWLTNNYKKLEIDVGAATAHPSATISFTPATH